MERKYIIFLRGINVSGQKIIRMADLKEALKESGFKNVITYIQSGNIILESLLLDPDLIKTKVKKIISRYFAFDVEIVVLTSFELEQIISACPYDRSSLKDGENIYFSLLVDLPTEDSKNNLLASKDITDELKMIYKTVFILCKRGFSKTIFNNNFIEKKLKVPVTTRNLNTMEKMMALVGKN